MEGAETGHVKWYSVMNAAEVDRGVQIQDTLSETWTGGYPNEVHEGSKIGHR